MAAGPSSPEAQQERGDASRDEAVVRERIEELLDSGAVKGDASGDDGRRRHRARGHRHHRHGSHHHRHRVTPRSARLQWWHILLVLVVGLLVTWVVISIAASPGGPPPE